MPDYVVAKVASALNGIEKSIKGSKILVLGIAYKKNVDDMRESPAVVIMEKLRDLQAHVEYSDPYFPSFPKMREHHFDLRSTAVTVQSLSQYDCTVLATDHDQFDYDLILEHARLIVDTRGKFRSVSDKIIKA